MRGRIFIKSQIAIFEMSMLGRNVDPCGSMMGPNPKIGRDPNFIFKPKNLNW